jgi:hypothetical protein
MTGEYCPAVPGNLNMNLKICLTISLFIIMMILVLMDCSGSRHADIHHYPCRSRALAIDKFYFRVGHNDHGEQMRERDRPSASSIAISHRLSAQVIPLTPREPRGR